MREVQAEAEAQARAQALSSASASAAGCAASEDACVSVLVAGCHVRLADITQDHVDAMTDEEFEVCACHMCSTLCAAQSVLCK